MTRPNVGLRGRWRMYYLNMRHDIMQLRALYSLYRTFLPRFPHIMVESKRYVEICFSATGDFGTVVGT
jgi:hypothetical protein